MSAVVVDRDGLDSLMDRVHEDGFHIKGPTVKDDAIVYDDVESTSDLPIGWTDIQDGGEYRIAETDSMSLFGFNLGPTSWKRFLFPPKSDLLHIRGSADGLSFEPAKHQPPKYAFFGVRACELAAIEIQDQVFMGGAAVDSTYATRREDLLLIAVNCGTAAATCFCTSMGTGPVCTTGFDIVITEMIDGAQPEYLLESGTSRGEAIVEALLGREAVWDDYQRAQLISDSAASSIVRQMDTDGIRDLLIDNANHPRWEDVAARCLTCGNCTLACPTCFCSTTVDTVSFEGEATRSRVWDSCFDLDFSSLHGHSVRGSAKSRYRQWMTHKLATWHDQFDSSGCVGCGRCITWCPVGIDITKEVAAMKETVTL